jgi:hypothetical protein
MMNGKRKIKEHQMTLFNILILCVFIVVIIDVIEDITK